MTWREKLEEIIEKMPHDSFVKHHYKESMRIFWLYNEGLDSGDMFSAIKKSGYLAPLGLLEEAMSLGSVAAINCDREPVRSMLFLSAAVLAFGMRDFYEARELANKGLDTDGPIAIDVDCKLREIANNANKRDPSDLFDRHGISLVTSIRKIEIILGYDHGFEVVK